jgi:hypothetical protein
MYHNPTGKLLPVLALLQICLVLINSGILILDMLNLLISWSKGTGHPLTFLCRCRGEAVIPPTHLLPWQ